MDSETVEFCAPTSTPELAGAPTTGVKRVPLKRLRIQRQGRIHDLGRRDPDTARRLRDEYKRTGRIGGGRSVRLAPGAVPHRDDAALWASEQDNDAPEELPGELRVMLAVLESTKADLKSTCARERLAAERWFASDDRSYLYAFATICDVFSLEPAHARRGAWS